MLIKKLKNIHFTLVIHILVVVTLLYSCSDMEYNILNYGAKGDGKTLSTEAIQKAIDRCFEQGGGIVTIPPGEYLTGTIILKSNVCLNLEKGSVLLGSPDPADYIKTKPKYIAYRTAVETRQLIYAEDQINISITGEGIIDGQGAAHKMNIDETDPNGFSMTDAGITRPHLIQFINCTDYKSCNNLRKKST